MDIDIDIDKDIHIYIHTYIHMYIYIYTSLFVATIGKMIVIRAFQRPEGLSVMDQGFLLPLVSRECRHGVQL